MAHPFKEIYVDELDFESITYEQLIELVFTEFVHSQIRQLEELDRTDGASFPSIIEDLLMDDSERWALYGDKALSMIDPEGLWNAVLEACKVLAYPLPSSDGYYRKYFERLYNLSSIMWAKIYKETEKTRSILNLLDYVLCIYKLKYDM